MADFPAEQFVADDFGHQFATDEEILAQQLIPSGAVVVVTYFEMRGLDSGASTTTWIVTGAPDPNGALATPANTTPTLVGSIVSGSGIVLISW